MSNFYMMVRHRETGEIFQAVALDDCFGRHEYGYSVTGFDEALREDRFFKLFERVEISQGDKP